METGHVRGEWDNTKSRYISPSEFHLVSSVPSFTFANRISRRDTELTRSLLTFVLACHDQVVKIESMTRRITSEHDKEHVIETQRHLATLNILFPIINVPRATIEQQRHIVARGAVPFERGKE